MNVLKHVFLLRFITKCKVSNFVHLY